MATTERRGTKALGTGTGAVSALLAAGLAVALAPAALAGDCGERGATPLSCADLPPGHPPVPCDGLPPGHPPVALVPGLPPGHPPVVVTPGLPPGHPPVDGLHRLPAGHPPLDAVPDEVEVFDQGAPQTL
ncbi:MAG TPA: hypothetical protein VMT17_06735 [Anaeromyxobacteraceae bacterium]|nr:hypothetical protein [Anaeromyxobacteraceae bacterium]